jgi:hypothetical protein
MSLAQIIILAVASAIILGCEEKRVPAIAPAPAAPATVPTAMPAQIPADQLAGRRYRSVQELEVGLGQHGPVPGHWWLSFGKPDGKYPGRFSWTHSDAGESGSYRLASDGTLLIWGTRATGRYDVSSDRVLWNDQWYERFEGR